MKYQDRTMVLRRLHVLAKFVEARRSERRASAFSALEELQSFPQQSNDRRCELYNGVKFFSLHMASPPSPGSRLRR
jgi:hypothetical protein